MNRTYLINFIDYLYQHHWDPEMDNILRENGATENTYNEDGLYASMDLDQLKIVAELFTNRYSDTIHELKYLYLTILGALTDQEYDIGYKDGFESAFKYLGKDVSKVTDEIGI
jgi:hypothetical protein